MGSGGTGRSPNTMGQSMYRHNACKEIVPVYINAFFFFTLSGCIFVPDVFLLLVTAYFVLCLSYSIILSVMV